MIKIVSEVIPSCSIISHGSLYENSPRRPFSLRIGVISGCKVFIERKIRSPVRPSRSSCYSSRARGKRGRNRLSWRFTSPGRDKIHEKRGDKRMRKKQKDRERREGKGRETSRKPRDGNWISTSKVLGRLALLLTLVRHNIASGLLRGIANVWLWEITKLTSKRGV